MSSEEILKVVPPEERLEGLTPDQVLKALSPEMLEQLVQRVKNGEPRPKSE